MTTPKRPQIKLSQAPLFEEDDDDLFSTPPPRRPTSTRALVQRSGPGPNSNLVFGLPADDELFATAQQPRIPTGHATCRVCGAQYQRSLDTAGLLCPLCREDLEKTARYVRMVKARAQDAKMREWAERAEMEIEAAQR